MYVHTKLWEPRFASNLRMCSLSLQTQYTLALYHLDAARLHASQRATMRVEYQALWGAFLSNIVGDLAEAVGVFRRALQDLEDSGSGGGSRHADVCAE